MWHHPLPLFVCMIVFSPTKGTWVRLCQKTLVRFDFLRETKLKTPTFRSPIGNQHYIAIISKQPCPDILQIGQIPTKTKFGLTSWRSCQRWLLRHTKMRGCLADFPHRASRHKMKTSGIPSMASKHKKGPFGGNGGKLFWRKTIETKLQRAPTKKIRQHSFAGEP